MFLGMVNTDQGPYSPTILKNVLSPVPQIFRYLETFECNTTSDWLNQEDKEFFRMVGEYGHGVK